MSGEYQFGTGYERRKLTTVECICHRLHGRGTLLYDLGRSDVRTAYELERTKANAAREVKKSFQGVGPL